MEKILPKGIDCCVVDVPDSLKGARIVAAVTGEINEKAMIKALSKDLPAIAIPSKFVMIRELPKMGSGKIDFRTVTKMVRETI
jgi:acyl-[acyl-carrier-protein]-phospholipid O-acyltransferase/long-chain-fatty-acid--[acyl-carrier-protein] ligase